jgi:hypothetical protein
VKLRLCPSARVDPKTLGRKKNNNDPRLRYPWEDKAEYVQRCADLGYTRPQEHEGDWNGHANRSRSSDLNWVETHCVVPSGPDRGKYVKLTLSQMQTIRAIYDHPDGTQGLHVSDNLAAYLALLHICGPQALERGPAQHFDIDPWTIWAATGPKLKKVLKHEPDAVSCPELGTRFPRRAAEKDRPRHN